MTGTNYFTSLEESECWALLAEHEVGRVAWATPEGIEILPVNYVLNETMVTFRTSLNSPLARLAEPITVAFQVDEIDHDTAIAWSVQVRGVTAVGPTTTPSVSWLVSEPSVAIGIVASAITGRVLSGTRQH